MTETSTSPDFVAYCLRQVQTWIPCAMFWCGATRATQAYEATGAVNPFRVAVDFADLGLRWHVYRGEWYISLALRDDRGEYRPPTDIEVDGTAAHTLRVLTRDDTWQLDTASMQNLAARIDALVVETLPGIRQLVRVYPCEDSACSTPLALCTRHGDRWLCEACHPAR